MDRNSEEAYTKRKRKREKEEMKLQPIRRNPAYASFSFSVQFFQCKNFNLFLLLLSLFCQLG